MTAAWRECSFVGGGPLEGRRLAVLDTAMQYAAPVVSRPLTPGIAETDAPPPTVDPIAYYQRVDAATFEFTGVTWPVPEAESSADWWCPCCGASYGSIEIDNAEIRCRCGAFCVDPGTGERPAPVTVTPTTTAHLFTGSRCDAGAHPLHLCFGCGMDAPGRSEPVFAAAECCPCQPCRCCRKRGSDGQT